MGPEGRRVGGRWPAGLGGRAGAREHGSRNHRGWPWAWGLRLVGEPLVPVCGTGQTRRLAPSPVVLTYATWLGSVWPAAQVLGVEELTWGSLAEHFCSSAKALLARPEAVQRSFAAEVVVGLAELYVGAAGRRSMAWQYVRYIQYMGYMQYMGRAVRRCGRQAWHGLQYEGYVQCVQRAVHGQTRNSSHCWAAGRHRL